MVNFVTLEKSLLHGLMKLAGLRAQVVEIEPGTTVNFWAPTETSKKAKVKARSEKVKVDSSEEKKKKTNKPAVVLLHGFAGDGLMTWQFQVGALTGKYAVYVPDFLFFGRSMTSRTDRSPEFQAECMLKGLKKLGVDTCTVVGFSYGGIVGFKMAELQPDMVKSLVVTGAVTAFTDSIAAKMFGRLGFSSASEFLLPTSVEGVKILFKLAMYMKLWLPDRLFKDYLQVMFNNRKEKAELLETMVVSSSKDATIPYFSQRIHILWGENDQIFNMEIAQSLKEQLGDNATLECIKKGGHLVHLERPFIYNQRLKAILASLHTDADQQ
ncbi:putative aminoacrylate hydrolase RutD [Macadamia integrifolia]|uniref:putative aminoacrylate hydrolase RutD n=1 Tax=Macadamia integrifolia TaxID=60698 RepID=UPI001C4F0572|nr:putative aminoacrylate hydrolase RutD [Macadamia integrifolia]